MRVYNSAFGYLYRITRYQGMEETKRYTGKSQLTLIFSPDDDAVHYLQRNGFIVTDEPFIIKHITQGLEEVEVIAYGCHKLLESRLTGSGATKNKQVSKTGSADVVVKHFIDLFKGDLPITTKAPRAGANISDQTRLKSLGDEVQRILLGAGRGELFALDNNTITFDTYAGADRTAGNTDDNPPVVFDLQFNNISKLTYTESAVDEQTTVYVGGAGEGSDREIIIVGGDKTGLDRVEVFRDARDVPEGETDKLTERGQQSIVGLQKTISTTAVADAGLVYGVDYKLGDIVTTRVTRRTYQQQGDFYNPVEEVLQVNQRITEVVITREAGEEYIDLRFGDEPITPSAMSSMGGQINQLAAAEPLVSPNGWIAANDTWTRTGNYVFTVAGDRRNKYQPRDKIKFTNGGSVKYAYITKVTYASGTTTINISLDATISAGAITDNYYSRAATPQGFNLNRVYLWSGAAQETDVITVPGFAAFSQYVVMFSGIATYMTCYTSPSQFRGIGGQVSSNGVTIFGFSGSHSGEEITVGFCGSMRMPPGAVNETLNSTRTLSSIYGVI
jgi:hypothetical protein